MSLQGELLVRVAWDGHRVRDARVESTRPFAPARALRGKTPAEAAATVPRLFSICSCAQGTAAAHALAGAGTRVDKAPTEIEAMLEAVQEFFWRLLIDWPQTMHHGIDAASVADVRRMIAAAGDGGADIPARDNPTATRELAVALNTIAARTVYGMSPSAWLCLAGADALCAWTEGGATIPARLLGLLLDTMPNLACSDVPLMPFPAREALMQTIAPAMSGQPHFASAPTWNGTPVETGALARMRSHPLVAALAARDGNSVATRMTARLAELATLLQELAAAPMAGRSTSWAQAMSLAPGEGLGAVETARGLLLHRVRLEQGLVAHYQIVAPTEWNFHPDGALVRGLRGLVADSAPMLEQRARLAVQALDPCVACGIEVGHA